MKVLLIDINARVINHWAKGLGNLLKSGEVSIHNGSLESFEPNGLLKSIVSPGNSFGFLGGGFDLAIQEYFGGSLFERYVRYKLMHSYVPVTNCTVIPLNQFSRDQFQYLLHIPTVVTPVVPDYDRRDPVHSGYRIVFDVTWNALHFPPSETEQLVLPGLCTGYAGVPIPIACKAMCFAIRLFYLKSILSQDLINTMIMCFMGYQYEPFISEDCLMECQKVGIDWDTMHRFNPHEDPLDSILPSGY
ncbi:putative ADP-ribose 1''-phosphate phosphatase [Kluyveromyces lactis]|uniref:KLLA0F13662p n=1 Tax=Kluyveromyces lactis (strain ATCC 8585 / CBS 2359 / DSM 70799 / NBRC 1267 / NRRL Y-1140 / WM37) TaxID=284590 RepID=Q6CK44_KLULA|nr:uncharacterized protein KLLA0_F13662g [Kluyveromyces lactis]CAG98403.1 KLLA0F13662p [Kluyveromyces lactis]|eukprot:XP_455695.1 uncharacterized protein KLLA0_F13662g [Kluyveromyces lactis]